MEGSGIMRPSVTGRALRASISAMRSCALRRYCHALAISPNALENWLRPCPIWNAKKNVPTLRLPVLMRYAPAASRPACTSRGIIRR